MDAFANTFKTALLLGALMGLFLLVGSQFGNGGLLVALVFGLIMNLGAWFFSDTIAIKSMRGREIGPDAPDGGMVEVPGASLNSVELYTLVDDLRRRADLPMPRVYVCPHDAPNAFATGRSPKKAAVAFTRGLLKSMTPDEIAGVAAHELAHIKHRDTLTSTIAATVAGVLAFVAQWFFLLGVGRGNGGNPLGGFLLVILAAVGAAVIKAMISRTREFAADAEGARIAGTPNGLISGLQKLDALSRRIPLQQPNPAQNNLFIVEPLAGGARSLTNLFATHPPVPARVEALRRVRIN
ncbi:MAG: M48 family metalloprotease [Phycisphaerales bacterium]